MCLGIMAAKRISMSCHRRAWDGIDKYVRETVRCYGVTWAVLPAEAWCQDSHLPEVMRCLTMPAQASRVDASRVDAVWWTVGKYLST